MDSRREKITIISIIAVVIITLLGITAVIMTSNKAKYKINICNNPDCEDYNASSAEITVNENDGVIVVYVFERETK